MPLHMKATRIQYQESASELIKKDCLWSCVIEVVKCPCYSVLCLTSGQNHCILQCTRGKDFLQMLISSKDGSANSTETRQRWKNLWTSTTLLWNNGGHYHNALASLVHFVIYTTNWTRDACAFRSRPEGGRHCSVVRSSNHVNRRTYENKVSCLNPKIRICIHFQQYCSWVFIILA